MNQHLLRQASDAALCREQLGEVVRALDALIAAEDEHGDLSNVVISLAVLKAKALLAKVGKHD